MASEKIAGYPAGEWIFAGILFVVGAVCVFTFMDSPAEKKKQAEAKFATWQKSHEAEEALKKARLAGAQALDAADDAIRNEAAERRAALEKASVRTTMSNKDSVRIDRYFLKRGGVITCTTIVTGNAPAMFNCDGNL